MKRGNYFILTSFILILIIGVIIVVNFVRAEDKMTVEVNLIGFGEKVSVQVPDYIYLGEVSSNNPISDEVRVNINNTGTLNITVTPQLVNSSEKVFSYLYFRTRKSSDDKELNKYHKLGDYNLNMTKKQKGWFYMILNLTDFEGSVAKNNMNYSAEVVFVAMPR